MPMLQKLQPSGFALASLHFTGTPAPPAPTGPQRAGRKHEEVIIMGNRAVITTPERKVGLYVH